MDGPGFESLRGWVFSLLQSAQTSSWALLASCWVGTRDFALWWSDGAWGFQSRVLRVMYGVILAHLYAHIPVQHNDNFLLSPFNTTDCYGKTFRGGGELYNYKRFMFQLTWANEGNTIWLAPNKVRSGQLEVAGNAVGNIPGACPVPYRKWLCDTWYSSWHRELSLKVQMDL
jgi:hypothetical protein